jgi:hypothetical protein
MGRFSNDDGLYYNTVSGTHRMLTSCERRNTFL